MEKIGCKKYGGLIEIQVAVQYYMADTVCHSCLNFDTCREEKEQNDIEEA